MKERENIFKVLVRKWVGTQNFPFANRKLLEKDYVVISLDFQLFGEAKFKNENIFSLSFGRSFLRELRYNDVDLNNGSAEAFETLRLIFLLT